MKPLFTFKKPLTPPVRAAWAAQAAAIEQRPLEFELHTAPGRAAIDGGRQSVTVSPTIRP